MRVTVLTGAGVSTDSGIPDYRGPDGLWRRDPDHEKLVTYRYYMGDPEIRRRSWLARRDNPAWRAEPNAAHRALAGLPDAWIITQNVDGLHQRAGSPAERVLELHGNMFGALCTACGARSRTREAVDRVLAGERDPACLACGGILKTTTVMFGQSVDHELLERAVELTEECEVFLAVGSSLQVQPAASLPRVAARAGARVIIVNAEPTPFDHLADEVVREPIGLAIPQLCASLV
ncbi:Sir2 family NAD-dependent protein deacetylase [Sphaerisporangium sp. TRM90804]|uniref:SIR2 family NAD-dependent protein deacylase n=1 Tax=Sphaerisporangium sp. TRM90804 TaxID=3031113 RepID=UPI002447493A|nr:Sir2 family NAD-dependent protein deacetylase [Sphaerisporangium sp. TRM90804]MDH2429177.1 Sir2 family NAD-dependent protein deacetylase [Sphaerisporangium sp. TRM90804]